MTNVDAEFIKDLETCLEVADQLSKLDTDEARLFVSEQLQNLHTFLQRKQKDAEDKIGEEIKKEEIEIAQLKKRIERATTSDGASESDVAYTDLNTLWSDLKENYWHRVFNAFIRETSLSVKEILDILINILKVCFTKCKDRALRNRTDMKFQVCYPGEKTSNKNLKPKEQDQNLDSLCRICQHKSTPFCIASIQEAVVPEVKTVGSISKQFKYKSKDLSKEIENYLEKCVKFCWVACLEEPEIILVTEPKKECKKIASEFINLDSTIYMSRPNAAYVEWPAIVQDSKVRVQWQLNLANQPRPEPKDLRGEQSLDYRVAGIEGADGVIMDDPDDRVNDDGKTTPFQSSDDTDKVKDETHTKNEHNGVKEKAKGTDQKNNKASKGYKNLVQGHPNTRF
ncbi:uncharacterized protein LOC132744333 [Ruditapes philippinarum]|uniref:uncharacterized protein LOC132744333 n=1 Tax=Ruditapes philippinarum TaxID=129788 RepID=UPI00295B58A2|nr:uncharacterized protein LOC132744333 [Ruditapes philippinarum]